MTRILTWNIGSFAFLQFAKPFLIRFKGQRLSNQYFQPILNGGFVSDKIKTINPDVLILQEFYYPDDAQSIGVLTEYPYREFIDAWYRERSILIASKNPFTIEERNSFPLIVFRNLNVLPMHLNSFHPSKRLAESQILKNIVRELNDVIMLGDSNVWSRGGRFLFPKDRQTYLNLAECLSDFTHGIISTTCFGFGLDKAFGSHNLDVMSAESPRWRGYFMDHYPVVLDLQRKYF